MENNNSTQWELNNTPLAQNNNNTLSGNLFGNNNLFNQNQSVWNKNQYQTQAPSRYNLKDLTDRLQQYQNNDLWNSNSTFNSGLNNSSIFSPNNMQSLNLNANSVLFPQQNSFSTYSQPYQLAQNSLPNSASDVDILSAQNSTDKIFDRVFNKTLGEEGGYEDRHDKIDTPTKNGIQQATLIRFKNKHPELALGFPEHVKNLTQEQARLIARKDYYEPYRIGEIISPALQETMFDSFFNHSPNAHRPCGLKELLIKIQT